MASKNDKEPNGAIIPKVEKPLPSIPEESVSEGKAAVTTFTDRAQAFMIMDKRDDEQIVNALQGQFSEEYIYDIAFKTPKGRCNCKAADGPHNHARGLSVTGVREGCRNMRGIQCQQIEEPRLIKEKGIEYYVACAEATDLISGLSEKKYYRVPLLKATKSGGTYADPYAYQIAQSKAERNAKSVLLPQEVVKAWIQDYLAGAKQLSPARAEEYRKKQKKLAPPPKEEQGETPPANNRTEKAKAVLDRLALLKVETEHQAAMVKKIGSFFGFDTKKQLKVNELETIHSFLYQVKMEAEKEMDIFSSLLNEVKEGK